MPPPPPPPLLLLLLLLPVVVVDADGKDCGPNCFGSKANEPCETVDDCFFSGCTCEYRGYKSDCVETDVCVGWKTTGSCSPEGERKPKDDKGCCQYVPSGWSGYCECSTEGGTVSIEKMMCGANKLSNFRSEANLVCQEACECFADGIDWNTSACASKHEKMSLLARLALAFCGAVLLYGLHYYCIPRIRLWQLRKRSQKKEREEKQKDKEAAAAAAAAAAAEEEEQEKLRKEVETLRRRLDEMPQSSPEPVVAVGIPMQHPTVVLAHPAVISGPPGFVSGGGAPAAYVPPPAYNPGCSPQHDAAYKHAIGACQMNDTEAKVYATDPSLGFTATVPPGFVPSQRLTKVRTPSGHLLNVEIPVGKQPGEEFHGVDTHTFMGEKPAAAASAGPPQFPPGFGP